MSKFITTLICFIILIFHSDLLSQTPDFKWQKSFGGMDIDVATATVNTPDNGYVVASNLRSDRDNNPTTTELFDIFVTKFDKFGNKLWKKNYGGSNNDVVTSIKKTSDKGFIICGYTDSYDGDITDYHGSQDIWILKIDSFGNLLWEKTLSLSNTISGDFGYDIIQTSDNNYYVSGYIIRRRWGPIMGDSSYDDIYIANLSSTGVLIWERVIESAIQDNLYSITQSNDGGVVVAGSTLSVNNYYNLLVMKFDSLGNMIWTKSYGTNKGEDGKSIISTSDGGYMILGSFNHPGFPGFPDLMVWKLNHLGNLVWENKYGGTKGDIGIKVIESSDGNFILCGESESNDGDLTINQGKKDIWLVKINPNGVILWQKSLGGSDDDFVESVTNLHDGGFLVCGKTKSSNGIFSSNSGLNNAYILKLLYCPDNYQFTNTVSKGIYQSQNFISSSVPIQNPTHYKAGNNIILLPGFSTIQNGIFSAQIDGCY